MRPCGENKH